MMGLDDRIGSIAPGKKADLVLIDARQPNTQPVHNPSRHGSNAHEPGLYRSRHDRWDMAQTS